MGGQVAVAFAGLVAVRLLTELVPREVFGEASLIFGALLLGRQLFLVPVGSAQIRFHPEYKAKGRAGWFSREIGRLAWLSAGAFAAVGACAYLVWRGLSAGGWRPFLALALAGILVTDVAKALRLKRLHAERRRAFYALWTGAEAWVWPALAALFLFFWTSTESYLAGQAAGSALALVIFGMIAYPRMPPDASGSSPEPRRAFVKKVLSYGLPLALLSLVGWAGNMGERYILAGFMGIADVGFYAAAYAVASRPFLLANGAVAITASPVLFEAESTGLSGKARRVFLLWMLAVACVGALGVLGFWLLGDWAAWLLLAEEYRAGAPGIFVWVAAGYAAFGLSKVVIQRMLSLGRSARVLLPAGLGAAANVSLALLLVPGMGALGAARAVAAGFAVRFVAVIWALRRAGASRSV